MGIDEFEVAAEDGNRCAQLVSSVVQHVALGVERADRRSSIAFIVRPRSATSSSLDNCSAGIVSLKSVSVMRCAVRRSAGSGESSRPATW